MVALTHRMTRAWLGGPATEGAAS